MIQETYWSDVENRRKYLLDFATKMGFDAMVTANWKGKTTQMRVNQVSIALTNMKRVTNMFVCKQGAGILTRYGGSVKAMLADTFLGMS